MGVTVGVLVAVGLGVDVSVGVGVNVLVAVGEGVMVEWMMGWVCCWRGGGRQRDDRQDVYGDVLIEHILTDPFALKLLHDAGLTRRDQKPENPSLSLNIRAENERADCQSFAGIIPQVQDFRRVRLAGSGAYVDVRGFGGDANSTKPSNT